MKVHINQEFSLKIGFAENITKADIAEGYDEDYIGVTTEQIKEAIQNYFEHIPKRCIKVEEVK